MLHWVTAVIDRPAEEFDRALEFWSRVTGTTPAERHGAEHKFATLVPAAGDACVKMQRVVGSRGVHIDLEVDDVEAAVDIAMRHGAAIVTRHPAGAVLQSFAGQQLCLVHWRGAVRRPAVVIGPVAVTSALDQVCIDIGPAAYDVEAAFYRALTGWQSWPSARPEFEVLKPPAAGAMRLLLQRLHDDRPTSAHLDFACSDADAVRRRHEELGGRFIGTEQRWIVMSDPSGAPYCLTERDPATGSLPS